jgi:type II secretory pathway component PulC
LNNKYLKYFLLAAVIGIWAAIAYRIVHGFSADKVAIVPANTPLKNQLTAVADTFVLYADYPDPFLEAVDSLQQDTIAKKNSVPVLTTPATALAPALPKEAITAIIQFNGIITNSKTKLRIAIITVHGKEHLVKEHEKVEGILIRKITKEAIRIIYNGESFTIENK